MHRKYKGHSNARKEALHYIIRSLACFLTRSLIRSLFSRSLAHSRLSRSLARSFSISIHTCLRHCQTRFLTRSRLSRFLARSFSITSASCVRSCNRTTQDGSTMTMMTTTFPKRKFPDSNFASQYLRS